jgi:hypothetical protein
VANDIGIPKPARGLDLRRLFELSEAEIENIGRQFRGPEVILDLNALRGIPLQCSSPPFSSTGPIRYDCPNCSNFGERIFSRSVSISPDGEFFTCSCYGCTFNGTRSGLLAAVLARKRKGASDDEAERLFEQSRVRAAIG